MNSYVNQYQNNHILNASPEQILIMLYDGAIRFCFQAMRAMDDNDMAVKAEKISKAMAIVTEFANTLDHEVGGEIAADLDALYTFMIKELSRANRENDRKALETVESLLSGLRETWVEAAKIYNTEKHSAVRQHQEKIAASL